MFKVILPQYQGPIDLLLYVIRKNELDILAVPLTVVLQQYSEYIAVIKEFDLDAAADFLNFASQLVEFKADKAVNGRVFISAEKQDNENSITNLSHLLEYKKYVDAAAVLSKRSADWQQRFPRLSNDLAGGTRGVTKYPDIKEIELWDLVSAFGRILRENTLESVHRVVYDDTPLQVHAQRIYSQLQVRKRIQFRSLFRAGQHKSSLIGLFLASLELVRHEFANVYQDINFGEIELARRQSSKPLDFAALNA